MELQKCASPVLRIGISFVFLWFGISQVSSPESWLSWLPSWTYSLPISVETIILLNGSFEIIFGTMLLLGFLTRIVAFVLFFHLLGITFTVGYNDVGIRDFGLSMATLSIALRGYDSISLDKKVKSHKLKKLIW